MILLEALVHDATAVDESCQHDDCCSLAFVPLGILLRNASSSNSLLTPLLMATSLLLLDAAL
jgi:hypothetical protein